VSEDTAALLTTIHKVNRNVLLALVALHVGTVLFYLLARRDNLVAPMLHGFKRIAAPAPRMAPAWLAAMLLLVAALAVWALVAWGTA
jgi:hypothetical protein